MTVQFNKKWLIWIAIILLEVAVILFVQGPWQSGGSSLKMTKTEAGLVRNAIQLVITDMDKGTIQSTEAAREALSSEIPSSIRGNVLKRIGTPDFVNLKSILTDVSESITIIQE